jgi:hypothetical protein
LLTAKEVNLESKAETFPICDKSVSFSRIRFTPISTTLNKFDGQKMVDVQVEYLPLYHWAYRLYLLFSSVLALFRERYNFVGRFIFTLYSRDTEKYPVIAVCLLIQVQF